MKTKIEISFSQKLEMQHQGSLVASIAAKILYEKFEVEKVVLFGSMTEYEDIHGNSDIDLALFGGNPDLFPTCGTAPKGRSRKARLGRSASVPLFWRSRIYRSLPVVL